MQFQKANIVPNICENSRCSIVSLLQIKYETKFNDVWSSRRFNSYLFQYWVDQAFQHTINVFLKGHSEYNSHLSHLTISPVLKKLLDAAMDHKQFDGKENYELYWNNIKCITKIFENIYKLQVEAVGKVDTIAIEQFLRSNLFDDFKINNLMEKLVLNTVKSINLCEIKVFMKFIQSALAVNLIRNDLEQYFNDNPGALSTLLQTILSHILVMQDERELLYSFDKNSLMKKMIRCIGVSTQCAVKQRKHIYLSQVSKIISI